jgi:hypothetical protein
LDLRVTPSQFGIDRCQYGSYFADQIRIDHGCAIHATLGSVVTDGKTIAHGTDVLRPEAGKACLARGLLTFNPLQCGEQVEHVVANNGQIADFAFCQRFSNCCARRRKRGLSTQNHIR